MKVFAEFILKKENENDSGKFEFSIRFEELTAEQRTEAALAFSHLNEHRSAESHTRSSDHSAEAPQTYTNNYKLFDSILPCALEHISFRSWSLGNTVKAWEDSEKDQINDQSIVFQNFSEFRCFSEWIWFYALDKYRSSEQWRQEVFNEAKAMLAAYRKVPSRASLIFLEDLNFTFEAKLPVGLKSLGVAPTPAGRERTPIEKALAVAAFLFRIALVPWKKTVSLLNSSFVQGYPLIQWLRDRRYHAALKKVKPKNLVFAAFKNVLPGSDPKATLQSFDVAALAEHVSFEVFNEVKQTLLAAKLPVNHNVVTRYSEARQQWIAAKLPKAKRLRAFFSVFRFGHRFEKYNQEVSTLLQEKSEIDTAVVTHLKADTFDVLDGLVKSSNRGESFATDYLKRYVKNRLAVLNDSSYPLGSEGLTKEEAEEKTIREREEKAVLEYLSDRLEGEKEEKIVLDVFALGEAFLRYVNAPNMAFLFLDQVSVSHQKYKTAMHHCSQLLVDLGEKEEANEYLIKAVGAEYVKEREEHLKSAFGGANAAAVDGTAEDSHLPANRASSDLGGVPQQRVADAEGGTPAETTTPVGASPRFLSGRFHALGVHLRGSQLPEAFAVSAETSQAP